ncbi:Plastocyanin [Natronoarchaeum philippinense]|uniref:Plastocyanin n=1 Tax=Natronoarchaeum philippinense TaxID=558529 RepID=A0A285N459_NATPI|nr:plastocyanin/azurin family copper-binding protein [Natronoarchaeum philippinense]SNZ02756.1 Plastocyanin [Natronoarchaeum philippinense]
MDDQSSVDRRTFLRASGVLAGVALAGCTDGGGDGEQEPADGNETGDGVDNETDGNQTGDNQTGTNQTDGNQTGGNQTGGNQTGDGGTVQVLAGPGGEFIFEPAQLSIAPGTTVRWTWESDNHNVVPTSQPDGANWQGHQPIENTGFEYEHTFETTGTYEYVCEPHESQGMVGTIDVQ